MTHFYYLHERRNYLIINSKYTTRLGQRPVGKYVEWVKKRIKSFNRCAIY